MKIETYRPTMVIRNVEQLPRGAGAKYLEVMEGEGTAIIAIKWRTKPPQDHELLPGRWLVSFKGVQ